MHKVTAIFCSDIHLSLTPPIWRSVEPDWLVAQKRVLRELKWLQSKYDDCPIFVAGDIFDKWYGAEGKGAAELINFATSTLPQVHAIPGQHDLPDHNLDEINRSAFQSLVNAGVVHDFDPADHTYYHKGIRVWGWPYGHEIRPCPFERGTSGYIEIALVHKYLWHGQYGFAGADQKDMIQSNMKEFLGYDIVVSGDNHQGFLTTHSFPKSDGGWYPPTIFLNCGTLMRRHVNEKDYKPAVGLLMHDGSIKRYFLNTANDVCVPDELVKEPTDDASLDTVLADLENLGDAALDFVKHLRAYIQKHGATEGIKKELFKATET